jgi:ubiquinone/menaquinone biosynthesis C-methylase UbiE
MNKKILNVGCGNDTYGTDFVDAKPRRKEVLKINVDEESLPYKNNYFDEVYSTFLFEHLTKPNFALKEMYRTLKPKGKIIIITDNAGCWVWHTPFTKINYGVHWGSDKHYALYTPHHLKNHLRKVGFKNIRTKYILVETKVPIWYVRIISNILYSLPFFFKRNALPHIIITATK